MAEPNWVEKRENWIERGRRAMGFLTKLDEVSKWTEQWTSERSLELNATGFRQFN